MNTNAFRRVSIQRVSRKKDIFVFLNHEDGDLSVVTFFVSFNEDDLDPILSFVSLDTNVIERDGNFC